MVFIRRASPKHFYKYPQPGVILELSDREKFCDNFRISGRSFGPNLDFPIHSIHFHFSLSSIQGEVSQLRETFSPKSPSRMTPASNICFNGEIMKLLILLCPKDKNLPRTVSVILESVFSIT